MCDARRERDDVRKHKWKGIYSNETKHVVPYTITTLKHQCDQVYTLYILSPKNLQRKRNFWRVRRRNLSHFMVFKYTIFLWKQLHCLSWCLIRASLLQICSLIKKEFNTVFVVLLLEISEKAHNGKIKYPHYHNLVPLPIEPPNNRWPKLSIAKGKPLAHVRNQMD